MATSDESLLAAIRESGDRSAYAELYRRHVDAARGAAYRIAPTLDGDDVVSEAFARILRTLSNGAGPVQSFRPYLYQTIRKVAIDLTPNTHVSLDEREETVDPETLHDVADVLADRELVVRALAAMPERWRTVLWYTEVEGLTPRAVAPIMGLTASNVSVIRHRARKRLRLLLEEGGPQSRRPRDLALGRRIAVAVLGAGAAEALLPGLELRAARAAALEHGAKEASSGAPARLLAVGGAGVMAVAVAAVLLVVPLGDEPHRPPQPQSDPQQPGVVSGDEDLEQPRPRTESADPLLTQSGASDTDDGSGWDRGPWEVVELRPPVVRGPVG